jgi:hypothetical protein
MVPSITCYNYSTTQVSLPCSPWIFARFLWIFFLILTLTLYTFEKKEANYAQKITV